MCGIIGSFVYKKSVNHDSVLKKGINLLNHRGPDNEGHNKYILKDGILDLCHTRLSIIDLSPLGNQPMQTPDGRYSIIFNGEIYNYIEIRNELKILGYVFKTNTDTEVLLYSWIHWNKECFKKILGMFSFVIFDKKTLQLLCARDSFGIKPFFYIFNDQGFYFSSEIPPLIEILEYKPKLDHNRAIDHLVWGMHDNQKNTFYKGVKHLAPGHFMTIKLSNNLKPNATKWWDPSISEMKINKNQIKENIRDIFLRSVKLHLRSDVPLGISLSGGLDSSAIIGAIKYLHKDFPINTFSYINNAENNEEKWIDLMNLYAHTNANKFTFTENDLSDDLDKFILLQGEPLGANSSYYIDYVIHKKAKESGIKVLLSGQGGDEITGGYRGYPVQKLHSMFEKKQYLSGLNFLFNWSKNPQYSKKDAVKILLYSLSEYLTGKDIKNIFYLLNKNNFIKNEFFNNHIDNNLNTIKFSSSNYLKGRRLAQRLLEHQTSDYCPRQLRSQDRIAMSFSMENRVPFLNTELAEFMLKLPEQYLVNNKGETKYIFKESIKDLLPNEILNRKDKIGMAPPPDIKISIKEHKIKEILHSGFEKFPFLSKNKILKYTNIESTDNLILNNENWRLLNFLKWADLNNINL